MDSIRLSVDGAQARRGQAQAGSRSAGKRNDRGEKRRKILQNSIKCMLRVHYSAAVASDKKHEFSWHGGPSLHKYSIIGGDASFWRWRGEGGYCSARSLLFVPSLETVACCMGLSIRGADVKYMFFSVRSPTIFPQQCRFDSLHCLSLIKLLWVITFNDMLFHEPRSPRWSNQHSSKVVRAELGIRTPIDTYIFQGYLIFTLVTT